MSGPELSQATERRVSLLFAPEERDEVRRILEDKCGNNLPFCKDLDSIQLERIRFGVLKLSEGNREKLERAVRLAAQDWRDLLMASGFANDVHAHESWVP